MSFTREWQVKAVRKSRRCVGCNKLIEVGQPSAEWAGMTDGDFGRCSYHLECRTAEVALNRLHGTFNPYDWQGLEDLERDDWPWLMSEHPAVADRLDLQERMAETQP